MKRIVSLALSVIMLATSLLCVPVWGFAEELDVETPCIHAVTHEVKNPAGVNVVGSIDSVCDACGEVVSSKDIYPVISVKLSKTKFTYSGKTQKPSLNIETSVGDKLSTKNYEAKFPSSSANAGSYTVKVTFKNDYEGVENLTYKILPEVTIGKATLAVGEKTTVTGKGAKSFTYRSSDKAIATVNSKGSVTGKKAGTAYIYAKGNGVEGKVKVTVKKPSIDIPSSATVRINTTTTLSAKRFPSSAKVTWKTSDSKIATVSDSGKVKGIKKGTATITAKITYNGKTYKDTCKVTVKNPALKVTSKKLYNSQTFKLEVIGGTGAITYKSSNEAVATVSKTGKVKGLKKGNCTITVKRNGATMRCEITVSPNNCDFTSIPDLGAMVGVERSERDYSYLESQGRYVGAYGYKKNKVEAKDKNWLDHYIKKLEDKGFVYYGSTYQSGSWVYIYSNGENIVMYYYYEDLIVIGMS